MAWRCVKPSNGLRSVPVVVRRNGRVLVNGLPCGVQVKVLESLHNGLGDERIRVCADLNGPNESVGRSALPSSVRSYHDVRLCATYSQSPYPEHDMSAEATHRRCSSTWGATHPPRSLEACSVPCPRCARARAGSAKPILPGTYPAKESTENLSVE